VLDDDAYALLRLKGTRTRCLASAGAARRES
jgi:hypothetical protein